MSTTQVTVPLVDFVEKLKEELSCYQGCDGIITSEQQIEAFNDVARIDFRVQSNSELPPAMVSFYDNDICGRKTKDYHYGILVKILDHLVGSGNTH